MVSVFQQLTGINAIIFYSSQIYSKIPAITFSPNTCSAITMFVNMLAAVGASFLLNHFGRKPLMVVWTALCAVCLFVLSYASTGSVQLAMTLLFVCAFEFAPGPVTWLYMGEIMTTESMTVGVFLNWLVTLVIGLVTPSLLAGLGASSTFFGFGVLNLLGALFYLVFMKETRGLNQAEVKKLFQSDY